MGGERSGGLGDFKGTAVRRDVPLLVPGARDEDRYYGDEATGRLYDEVAPSVVHIYSKRNPSQFGPSQGTGSGYFVDNEGRIMTDAHVVHDSKELWVTTKDGKQYRGQIEKVDDIQDLAVVKLIGVKPGQYKPLESASSLSLQDMQSIYAFGHPHGSRSTFVSPGSFLRKTSMLDVLARQAGIDEVADLMRPEHYPKKDDFYDFRDNLTAPVISGRMRLEGGNSGGPIVDQSGKVVGIAREVEMQDHSSSFYSPVESADSLLRNPRTKFAFHYGYEPEAWAKDYTSMWKDNTAQAAGLTALAGGAGYLGIRMANKLGPRVLPAMTGVYFGLNAIDDFDLYKTSTNKADAAKFGIATLADVTAVGGSIAALFPQSRTVGLIAMGVGAGARFASDFIPNNYVMTGTTRDDGSSRAPFSRAIFLEEMRRLDVPQGYNRGFERPYRPDSTKPDLTKPDYNNPPKSFDYDWQYPRQADPRQSDQPLSNPYNKHYEGQYKSPYLNNPSGMPKLERSPLLEQELVPKEK